MLKKLNAIPEKLVLDPYRNGNLSEKYHVLYLRMVEKLKPNQALVSSNGFRIRTLFLGLDWWPTFEVKRWYSDTAVSPHLKDNGITAFDDWCYQYEVEKKTTCDFLKEILHFKTPAFERYHYPRGRILVTNTR